METHEFILSLSEELVSLPHCIRIERNTDPQYWPVIAGTEIRSPIHFDLQYVWSNIKARKMFQFWLIQAAMRFCAANKLEDEVAILAVDTGSIAPALLLAEALDIPLYQVTPTPHGKLILAKGNYRGKKIVLVSNILASGQSIIEAAQLLRSVRAEVVMCFSLFTYGYTAVTEQLAENAIPVVAAVSFIDILSIMHSMRTMKSDNLRYLGGEYLKQPPCLHPPSLQGCA